MRNNRQPTTTGGSSDSLQQILETMAELQWSNEEFRKQAEDRERDREVVHIE